MPESVIPGAGITRLTSNINVASISYCRKGKPGQTAILVDLAVTLQSHDRSLCCHVDSITTGTAAQIPTRLRDFKGSCDTSARGESSHSGY